MRELCAFFNFSNTNLSKREARFKLHCSRQPCMRVCGVRKRIYLYKYLLVPLYLKNIFIYVGFSCPFSFTAYKGAVDSDIYCLLPYLLFITVYNHFYNNKLSNGKNLWSQISIYETSLR